MNLHRKQNKSSNFMWIIITLVVALMIAGAVFFASGKFNVAPAKEAAGENSKAVVAHKQEQNKQEQNKQEQNKMEKNADGRPEGKWVYLTIDDGPSKYTGQILDILQKEHIKATFFMQGVNLQKTNLQEYVKRADKEGHYIGAHSMTHDPNKLYKQGTFMQEMKETISLIHDITGKTPKLIRAPYGSVPGLTDKLQPVIDAGLKMWDWNIDSEDATKLGINNPDHIVETIKKETNRDIEVVLIHDKIGTLQKLPEIIQFFREKGYNFGVYNEKEHFPMNFKNDSRI
ncbi:peptidoglycan-N-acetylglucosamine deacetylase [Bacillus thuringiensis serovar yunnanensis]|nr:peptidoglycan-N-acetylglucosamine deacetylase [Bacillus thuringiensis serovar yunnanensis]